MKSDCYRREIDKTAKKSQKSQESGDCTLEIYTFMDLTGVNAHPAAVLIIKELLLLRLLQTSIVQGRGVPLSAVTDGKGSGDTRFMPFGTGYRRRWGWF